MRDFELSSNSVRSELSKLQNKPRELTPCLAQELIRESGARTRYLGGVVKRQSNRTVAAHVRQREGIA